MPKGWFAIEGVQEGDRTLEDQIKGLGPALAECAGKSVLDLGTAEGLIGREFARAGASGVVGIEYVEDHLKVARKQCAGLPMRFIRADLNALAREFPVLKFDIVLSLGVCHKLKFPDMGVRYSARAANDLVVFGFSAREEFASGVMRSKHYPENTCNVYEIMEECGFKLEKILPRSRQETAQYWRRA